MASITSIPNAKNLPMFIATNKPESRTVIESLTNAPLKLSGGGVIASNEKTSVAIFGFSINHRMGDPEPKGNFVYQDHKINLRLQATSFDRLAIQGNRAWIAGTGRIGSGRELKFTVEIDTNHDTFYICIPAFEGYKAGGALSGGNISIH